MEYKTEPMVGRIKVIVTCGDVRMVKVDKLEKFSIIGYLSQGTYVFHHYCQRYQYWINGRLIPYEAFYDLELSS